MAYADINSDVTQAKIQQLASILNLPVARLNNEKKIFDEADSWVLSRDYYWEDCGPYPGNSVVYRSACVRQPQLTVVEEGSTRLDARIKAWLAAIDRESEQDPAVDRGKTILVVMKDGTSVRTRFVGKRRGVLETSSGDMQIADIRLITLTENLR